MFAGPFTLEAAEAVLSATGVAEPLRSLEALIDASLLTRTDHATLPAFRLLSLVRAYAPSLGDPAQRKAAIDAWTGYYRELAQSAPAGLRGPEQLVWLARFELESDNLAQVMRTLLDERNLDAAAEYAWSMYLFLWIGGHLGLVRGWMIEALDAVARGEAQITPRSRAIALYYANAIRLWQGPDYDTVPGMIESRALFEQSGDTAGAALAGVSIALALLAQPDGPDFAHAVEELQRSLSGFRDAADMWGQAMSLVVLGRVEMLTGALPSAHDRFEESLDLATSQGERLGIVISLNHRGWVKTLSGDLDGGREDFRTGLDLSLALQHDEGIAYGLEAYVGLRAMTGDVAGAGRLLGAAQSLRRRKGILNPDAFEFYMIPLGAVREAGRGEELDRAVAEGLTIPLTEALAHVTE